MGSIVVLPDNIIVLSGNIVWYGTLCIVCQHPATAFDLWQELIGGL